MKVVLIVRGQSGVPGGTGVPGGQIGMIQLAKALRGLDVEVELFIGGPRMHYLDGLDDVRTKCFNWPTWIDRFTKASPARVRALGTKLRTQRWLKAVSSLVSGADVVHVQGHVLLSRVLPFSNLIVISNWQPWLVRLLAGLIWYRLPGGTWRRSLVSVLLVGSCLISIYRPILAQPPQLYDMWEGNICLQTSQVSCTPAAAATLLAAHGIKTTEEEMALLCLTNREGTPMQGLYRGLKLKTADTPWEPYMFRARLWPRRAE